MTGYLERRSRWKGSRHCSAGWMRTAGSCFRRSGGEHRERDPGFPQCGRPVSPAVPVPSGDHPEPQLFDRQPEEFYRFYRGKMPCLDARPNAAHKKLAELERGGRLRSVVTRTSTACTRRQAPRRCGSSTAPSCAIGVCPAGKPWPVSAVAEAHAPLYLRGRDQAGCGAL